MKFDIKHILIFGLALGMTSCVETMKDGDMSTGFLGIPVLDADIQVEEFGATKATPAPTLPTLSVPESSALHFKVTDSKSNVVWNQKGLWRDPLKMPVGSYTIEVTYGPNTYGNPWYTGTCTGTISAVTEAEPATIRLSLCNSLLAVVLADDFAQHFTPSEGNCVTITSTSGSTSTTLGNYVFVPAGEALTIQVAGTSSAGISKTLSWTLKNPLSAATATYVTCSLTTTNAPTITMSEIPVADAWGNTAYVPLARTEHISEANVAKMQYFASSNEWVKSDEGTIVDIDGEKLVKFTGLTPGATYKVRAQLGALKSNEVSMTMSTSALSIKTVAHTKTNNELDGTDFTATFSVLDKFGVTGATISLCKTDGTVLRTTTLTGTTADWTSDGSAESAWPYLPEGAYTLKGQVTQDGQTIDLAPQQINAPATDFQIEVTGTTSYDLYTSGSASAANKADPESITGIGYTVKISQALKDNSNYSYSDTFTLDGNDAKNTTSVSGQSWANHPLVAKATFAGKEITVQKDCHITGLPYKAVPPTSNSNDIHKWNKKSGTISWESDKVTLSWATGAYPCIYSPDFHIPNDINVSARTKIVRNKTTLNYNSELGIWVNENDKAYSANLNNGSTFENTISETMTATYNKWYIQYNYMATGPKTYVYYFNIDYN